MKALQKRNEAEKVKIKAQMVAEPGRGGEDVYY